MIIEFNIKRKTTEGESVYIVGSSSVVGHYIAEQAPKLTCQESDNEANEKVWKITLKVDPYKERIFSYKYFTKTKDGKYNFEAGGGRRLALNSATQHITTIDQWQENDENAPFLTDPFAHVFYGAKYSPYTQTHRRLNELIIRTVIPNMPNNCHLVLVGNSPELGNWHPNKGIRMARLKGLKWIASIGTEQMFQKGMKRLEYKFIMVKDDNNQILREGAVHTITIPQLTKHQTLIIEHSNSEFENSVPKFAGVTISLAALRSSKSCGIGEISDLKLLIDWAEKVGMKVINILPINDTTRYLNSKDSSPYNCISSIALNPIYLPISSFPEPKNEAEKKYAQEEQRSLNRRSSIDFEDVYAFKFQYFRARFEEYKEELVSHPNYYKFIKENKEWLYSYALFCSLRDYFKSANQTMWGKFSKYSQTLVDQISSDTFNFSLNQTWGIDMKPIHSGVMFYVYLQFLLYNQMREIIHYAHNKGIAIAGELPLNVSPEGVDAWKMPYLFKFQGDTNKSKRDNLTKIQSIVRASQTGALTPVFNWEKMREEKYLWWIMRVRAVHSIYDIISLGRIEKQSTNNTQEEISDSEEIATLIPQLVSASNMLICGKYQPTLFDNDKSEKLAEAMKKLKILSLSLPQEESPFFSNSGYYSVSATSTSTSKTLRLWIGEKNKSISYTSTDDGITYYDATPQECKDVINECLSTESMFALISIQDWISIEPKVRNRFPYSEVMGNPDITDWVWKYRMHLTLEELLSNEELNVQIQNVIKQADR